MNLKFSSLQDKLQLEDDSYPNVEDKSNPDRRYHLEADILGTEASLSEYKKEYARLVNAGAGEEELFWVREYIQYFKEDLEYLQEQLLITD